MVELSLLMELSPWWSCPWMRWDNPREEQQVGCRRLWVGSGELIRCSRRNGMRQRAMARRREGSFLAVWCSFARDAIFLIWVHYYLQNF